MLLDLIGFWTKGMITHVHSEDEGIYFDPNGTGFITWSNPFVETFNTFTWSLVNDCLAMTGIKKIIIYHGKVQEISSSELNESSLLVRRIKCKSLDDDLIDSLVFTKTSDMFSEKILGFICKDIWGIEHYCGLKEFLSRGGD